MADENSNSGLAQNIAHINGERVRERAILDYPRHFWESIKAHHRYALVGVAILAPCSALIGAAVAGVIGFASFVIPTCTVIGSLLAAEGFGAIGVAAASRASGLAEKHARVLDNDAQGKDTVDATDDKLMYNGKGHHFEFPVNRDQGKLFSFKSGSVGAVMGAVSGGLLGLVLAGEGLTKIPLISTIAAGVAHTSIIAGLATAVAVTPLAAGFIVAGAIALGALGLAFGVERGVLKSFFNRTDSMVEGKTRFFETADLGRQQSQESEYDLGQHRLQRQATIDNLKKDYMSRIFWGSLAARFKGYGGVVPGSILGAAIGGLVFCGLVLAAHAALVAAFPVIPLFAAALGMYSMDISAQSATEAGAESTARAIDNEFERNRALRAQGITPPKPKTTEGHWFDPKAALIAGAAGVGIGLLLTFSVGTGFLAMPLLANLSGPTIVGISALVCGLTGATYGMGSKLLKAMAAPAEWLYDKTYFSHNNPAPEVPAPQIPAQASGRETITPEDNALLNERLATGSGKSLAQISQQMQAAPAGLQV